VLKRHAAEPSIELTSWVTAVGYLHRTGPRTTRRRLKNPRWFPRRPRQGTLLLVADYVVGGHLRPGESCPRPSSPSLRTSEREIPGWAS
jgi:hypothetical protein